jgi:hypothetical protein
LAIYFNQHYLILQGAWKVTVTTDKSSRANHGHILSYTCAKII